MTSPTDRARALLDMEVVQFDHKNAGEKVVGEVVELSEIEGKFGVSPLLTLEDRGKLVRVICGATVLKNEILGRDVRIGDVLGIEYQGEQIGRDGTKYQGYRVVHIPSESRPNNAPRIASVRDSEPREQGTEYGEAPEDVSGYSAEPF